MNKLITEAGEMYLLDALMNENPNEDQETIDKIMDLVESDTDEGKTLAAIIRDIDAMINSPEPDENLIGAMEGLLVKTAHDMIEAKEDK